MASGVGAGGEVGTLAVDTAAVGAGPAFTLVEGPPSRRHPEVAAVAINAQVRIRPVRPIVPRDEREAPRVLRFDIDSFHIAYSVVAPFRWTVTSSTPAVLRLPSTHASRRPGPCGQGMSLNVHSVAPTARL